MKTSLLILHNIIAPYRSPLFEEINKHYNLTVYFCESVTKDRKWSTSLKGTNYKSKVLGHFSIGRWVINPALLFLLIKYRYDIYLIDENEENITSVMLIYLFSKIFNKPLVIWSEHIIKRADFLVYERKITKRKLLFQMYSKILEIYRKHLYNHANSIISCSGRYSDEFIRMYEGDSKKIFTGLQAVPKQLLLQPISKVRNDKTAWDKTIVLYIGYLRESKGVDYLIKAFNSLKNNKMLLYIAGAGPETEKLKIIANGSPSIVFLGHLDDSQKAYYYSISDIFVLPTLHDPWGLVLNEALYYGLPVIVTKAAAASQLIKDGVSGYIIDEANERSIQKAIEKANENLSKMKRAVNNMSKVKLTSTEIQANSYVNAIRYAQNLRIN